MRYYEYITRPGDRWDLIAWEFYGDPHAYEPIVMANPDVLITPTLPAGIKIKVPVREEVSSMIRPEGLPPWKR